MRAPLRAIALLLAVCCCACATIETRGSSYQGPRVYSGTRQDLRGLGVGFLNLNPLIVLLYLVDLPCSALADTVLLPLTISEESRRDEAAVEHGRLDRDVPAAIDTREESSLAHARRLVERCRQLYEALEPAVTDCYAIDARIVTASGETLTGASYKQRLRDAIRTKPELSWVSYQNPRYTAEVDRVRVDATRTSSFTHQRTSVSLVLAAGADGGWRIVEETGIDWP